MLNNHRDYLLLIWKEPKTHTQYIVGELSKNGDFEFEYKHEYSKAKQEGFEPLAPFEEEGETYRSEKLFLVFASRLPDRKRSDIDAILKKYKLTEYDEYELLKRTGARLPIDNLEFIDPIFENEDKVERMFFLAGSRHYLGCQGSECSQRLSLEEGDPLSLLLEPNNEYDPDAIKVYKGENHIGYIPRYYSQAITNRINNGSSFLCVILEVNNNNNACSECVKVHLKET